MHTQYKHYRLLQPLKQGEYDSLCGLYALINAARLADPTLHTRTCKTMFTSAINWLSVNNKLTSIMLDGTPLGTLMSMHKAIVQRRKPDLRLYRPFLKQKAGSPEKLWCTLQHWQSAPCGIIIGITGKYYHHWSVVHHIGTNKVALFDSSTLKELHRKNCDITPDTSKPHVINPTTILIAKKTIL